MDTNHRSTGSRLGLSFALLLCSALGAACGDSDTGGGGGAGGSGEGGATGTTSTGDTTTSGTTTGGGAGGEDAPCECDEGTVEVEDCLGHGECAPKTCGSDTVQCAAIVPCSPMGCVGSNLPGQACGVVGEECQTIDCHGEPAELIICTEEQIWTSWSSLYFECGEETCLHGLDYCEYVSDLGNDPVFQCLPIPEGCSNEDFCACEAAYEVCPQAECATLGGGGWVITCW